MKILSNESADWQTDTLMQSASRQGTLPASAVARLARGLFALCGAGAAQVDHLLDDDAVEVSAAEAREAEELDVSYVRSKGTSVLFGPLVKCVRWMLLWLPGGCWAMPAAQTAYVTCVLQSCSACAATLYPVQTLVARACRPDGEIDAAGDAADQAGDGRQRKRKNRKRKPRYPKDFDPENPGPLPDPERWLPKHKRAEFKKRRKGKQRNQPVSKGAQVRLLELVLISALASTSQRACSAAGLLKGRAAQVHGVPHLLLLTTEKVSLLARRAL